MYTAGGEIPLTARGAGFQTSDGFRTRTPWTKPVNAQASYRLKVGGRDLHLIADVFNVFNTQTILDYNNFSELQSSVPNSGLRPCRRVWCYFWAAVHDAPGA